MDKIQVIRANVILDVSPEDKEYYMGQGFSVLDEAGNVVEEAMSNDVGTLQVQVTELRKEVADLKAKLAEKAKTATTAKKATEKKADA